MQVAESKERRRNIAKEEELQAAALLGGSVGIEVGDNGENESPTGGAVGGGGAGTRAGGSADAGRDARATQLGMGSSTGRKRGRGGGGI